MNETKFEEESYMILKKKNHESTDTAKLLAELILKRK